MKCNIKPGNIATITEDDQPAAGTAAGAGETMDTKVACPRRSRPERLPVGHSEGILTMLYLAGDIGGTKTNLAVYSLEKGARVPLAEGSYRSKEYVSLEELVKQFLKKHQLAIHHASFGVAGPVVEGAAQITNLPWVMEERQLAENLSFETVRLLNDLSAIAHAVPFLQPDELYTLNTGDPVEHGAMGVIAPGTGLGEAFLTWEGGRYVAHDSEGGHVDFAPVTPLQMELLTFLHQRMGHVSYEWVCSGIGIPNLYQFLKESGHAEEPYWLREKLAQAPDPTPVIAQAAFDSHAPCDICVRTFNLFVEILAAEAGNLALKVMATGGVFLGGGIPPRILPLLKGDQFLTPFRRKGRMSRIVECIPVHVILNPGVALLGAAYHGAEAGFD